MRPTRLWRGAVAMAALFAACASARGADWEQHRLGSAGLIQVVEIELYRGIVRFHGLPEGDPVLLRTALVSYDDHRPGESIEASARPLPEGALELSTTSGTARIAAPTLRDLVVVDLSAPAATVLRIRIVHYGEVTVEGALGELEINQFQGQVDLRGIRGPALVHIARDGSISARLVPPVAEQAMAFTTYEGDIDLELPKALSGRLQVGSVRGVVRNEMTATPEGGPRAGEPNILVRNAKGTIHVHPIR